jgi:hypothetical protein
VELNSEVDFAAGYCCHKMPLLPLSAHMFY